MSRTIEPQSAVGLVLIALPIAFRRDRDRIEPWHLVVLASAFLLLVSPHYPWYYAIAVPILVACPYPPLLWLTLVVTAIYLEIGYVWLVPYPRFKVFLVMYCGFVVLAVAHRLWPLRADAAAMPSIRPARSPRAAASRRRS